LTGIDWLEVRVAGPSELAAQAELSLQSHRLPGWVDESLDTGFAYLVYLAQEPGWQERLEALRQELASYSLTVTVGGQVKDEDWAENWKRFYHPMRVGRSLVICPSWEEYTGDDQRHRVILDPGSAFGTGYHPTTRLCLELLEKVEAGSYLDVGTGSGILAIAAHKLGAGPIVAVDNDPVAVKVARENLALNQVPAQVELSEGPPAGSYRVVTANLVAAVLIELAEALSNSLAPSGQLICGGIIEPRAEETLRALTAAGLDLVEQVQQEDWVSLRLRRP
jgi:ribosomal protein L11 methyltransferase